MEPNRVISRRQKWARVALIQLVLWPTLLLGSEGVYRVFLSTQGVAYQAEGARQQVAEAVDRSVSFVPTLKQEFPTSPTNNDQAIRMLHPFLGYVTTGGLRQLEAQLTHMQAEERDDEYVILILGGSVAQMFGQFGDKRLVETLTADERLAGKAIHFMRFGEGGYKQPQQAMLLSYLLALGLKPDAVINIDGYNEIALGVRNVTFGAHPVFPAIPHWGSLVSNWSSDRDALDLALVVRGAQKSIKSLAETSSEWGLLNSAILGTFVVGRIGRLSALSQEATEAFTDHLTENSEGAVLHGPRMREGFAPDVAVGEFWSECSKTMQAACDARDIFYLHVLQPTLHDRGSKKLTPGENDRVSGSLPIWLEGVDDGYSLLRKLGERLVDEGVNFVDLSGAFSKVEKDIYVDNCHYNGKGNRILGRQVGRAFLERL